MAGGLNRADARGVVARMQDARTLGQFGRLFRDLDRLALDAELAGEDALAGWFRDLAADAQRRLAGLHDLDAVVADGSVEDPLVSEYADEYDLLTLQNTTPELMARLIVEEAAGTAVAPGLRRHVDALVEALDRVASTDSDTPGGYDGG